MDYHRIFKILTTQMYVLDISAIHERSEKKKQNSILFYT